MISRTRRHLLAAVKAFQRNGSLPKCGTDPSVYRNMRGGQHVYASDANWVASHADMVAHAPLKAPVAEGAE